MYCFFFFFSSRRRHTRYWRDWSSDVCSSEERTERLGAAAGIPVFGLDALSSAAYGPEARSEERREGKSVDIGGRSITKKKKTSSEEKRRLANELAIAASCLTMQGA